MVLTGTLRFRGIYGNMEWKWCDLDMVLSSVLFVVSWDEILQRFTFEFLVLETGVLLSCWSPFQSSYFFLVAINFYICFQCQVIIRAIKFLIFGGVAVLGLED